MTYLQKSISLSRLVRTVRISVLAFFILFINFFLNMHCLYSFLFNQYLFASPLERSDVRKTFIAIMVKNIGSREKSRDESYNSGGSKLYRLSINLFFIMQKSTVELLITHPRLNVNPNE